MEHQLDTALGSSRIWIGRGGGGRLEEALGGSAPPLLLVTDARVARAQGFRQERLLDKLDAQRLVLPEGEEAKNSANLLTVLGEMAQLRMERGSALLAWGGGMVGDLGGLAASLWHRGLPFLYVPTSLLSMVDASVGGKTAINFGGIRNAVGAYWPARFVLADLDALETLPEAEWSSGFGELLKTAWLCDDHWAGRLEADPGALLCASNPELQGHIERAVLHKASVVSQDLRDGGPRRLLNLGHSFAHAAEALLDGELRHGHAVLLGMLGAVLAARALGVATPADADEMEQRLLSVLRKLELLPAPRLAGLPAAELVERMAGDKKVRAGCLELILPERPGMARVEPVPLAQLGELVAGWQKRLA